MQYFFNYFQQNFYFPQRRLLSGNFDLFFAKNPMEFGNLSSAPRLAKNRLYPVGVGALDDPFGCKELFCLTALERALLRQKRKNARDR